MTAPVLVLLAGYVIVCAYTVTAMMFMHRKMRRLERKLRDAEVLANALRRLLTSFGVETTITDTSDGYAIQTVHHHRAPREWH